ncbi:Calmodulin-binding transcription activator 1 [Halotydeus destructor]|nr:Calmodulin-binding transcription activator 1 [Halotydeus destructor]
MMDTDSDPLPQLPDSLEAIQRAEYFTIQRHRWNTNEEIASILISFDKHESWLCKEVKIRRDGYCWKKRKDGKTTREDHMKLKVQGTECIYGCYVHSAILPTFHRRCYWLLQNPDTVLVHYLNVPYTDDNKMVSPTLNYFADSKKEWTKDELISELKPMFFSENDPVLNNELDFSTVATIDTIVQQMMSKQRAKIKAMEEASDIGISARALNVVNAAAGCSLVNLNSSKATVTIAKEKSNVTKSTTATCILATPTNQSSNQQRPASVQLLQLTNHTANSSHSKTSTSTTLTTQTTAANGQLGTGSNSTSLIFNLSQLQNGNGILILNSPTSSSNSNTVQAPVALLYSRGSNNCVNNVINAANSFQSGNVNLKSVTINQNFLSESSLNDDMKTDCTDNNSDNQSVHFGDQATSPSAMDIANGNNVYDSLTSDPSVIKNEGCGQNDDNNTNQLIKRRPPASKSNMADANCVDGNQLHDNIEDMTIGGSSPPLSRNDNVIVNAGHSSTSPIQSRIGSASNHTNLLRHHNNSIMLSVHPGTRHHHGGHLANSVNSCNSNHANNYDHHHNAGAGNSVDDVNPMDFIDNDISTPDDELFSLEAFDMIAEFPNMDDDNLPDWFRVNQSRPSTSRGQPLNCTIKQEPGQGQEEPADQSSSASSSAAMTETGQDGLALISDYSPEWSYSEGGVKVLVAGPWNQSTGQYSILFDGITVPSSLVQHGVLRCFSPAHEPGYVSLQVAMHGCIVSNSVIFEFREHPRSPSQASESDYFVDGRFSQWISSVI